MCPRPALKFQPLARQMPLDFQAKPSALCEARRTRSSPPCCLVCLPLSGVARLSPRLLAGNASSLVPRVPPRPESCQSDRHAVSLSCAPPTRSSQLGRTPPCGDASASLSRSARPACLQSTSDYQRHGHAIPTASALTPQHKQNARLPRTLCALWPLLTFASRFLPASVPPHHPRPSWARPKRPLLSRQSPKSHTRPRPASLAGGGRVWKPEVRVWVPPGTLLLPWHILLSSLFRPAFRKGELAAATLPPREKGQENHRDAACDRTALLDQHHPTGVYFSDNKLDSERWVGIRKKKTNKKNP